MKRLITCLVALFLVTVMAWSQGTKKINSIKRSNQYLYAEATMPTQAEAFEVANDLLLIQVKEYAGSKKAFDDKDILIRNINSARDSVQLRRGEMVKVFLYVKKSDIEKVGLSLDSIKDVYIHFYVRDENFKTMFDDTFTFAIK